MVLSYKGNLKQLSQRLRVNMTDAERHLWAKIRMNQLNGYRFYRQKPIGDYIVDFFCPKAKLVIEVDGGQHLSDEATGYDRVRDECMSSAGLKVLRFTNIDVLTNIEGVVESITENMGAEISLNPSLRKRESRHLPLVKGEREGFNQDLR